MARVLLPVMARQYDPNPRGSATTTVIMKGNNPFERTSTMVNGRLAGGALPGMSGLGEAAPAAAPAAPAAPAAGTDWGAVAAAIAQAGVQVGSQAIQHHYAVNQPIPSTITNYLPVVNPNVRPAPKKAWVPWAVGGGTLVLGVGLIFLFMRKH
jgi:hypothetical protein